MLLFFMCLLLPHLSTVSSQDGLCCSFTSGSCRTACQQLSMATIAADSNLRQRKLKVVKNFCSYSLANFWQCMNETLSGVEKGQGWSGRHCCHIPQSGQCQRACVLASHRDQLTPSCRKSDELAFFSCLDRQEMGENCCGQAKTPECLDSCKSIFFSHLTPKKEQREAVIEHCEASSPKVAYCVKNLTKVTPAPHAVKYLHCCDKTSKDECKESCKKHLKSKAALQEIVDNLQEGGCGPPLPHDELWQCFLHSESVPETSRGNELSRIDRAGMDSAKLHCCARAVSPICRRLCIKTFSDEWMRAWADFDKACLSSLTEDRLQACIDEVEEPCELGCDGLNYCSNFNNRPTELFRSCTTAADEAARHDVTKWRQEGFLDLPGGLLLPLKNISRCSPDVWATVACALQIKPCHRDSHGNRICKEDCYEILTECMDWSRMPFGQTVSSLCALLSPGDKNSPCVSLKPFLEPSDTAYASPGQQVTAPCKGDPCDSQELCTVNRNCEPGRPCQTYQCLPGCRLGEASWFVVPVGSYVRIPIQTEHKGCVKICQCTENRLIEKCQPLPCVPIEDCWLGNKKIEHGKTFYPDCNVCSCFAGEITCSKKQCKGERDRAIRRLGWASLPCNCLPHYEPYCGRNGYTYPNACLAKCAGLRDGDFESGACLTKDPCEANPCGDGMKCVISRKVCLSFLENPCQQHICIDPFENCSNEPRAPVCDAQQQEHPNMCYLVRAGRTLAYTGPCRTGCNAELTVCGIDGSTYTSECAALSRYIAVDYKGKCAAVGLVTDFAQPMCSNIICPSLPSGGCLAVTPPGACCPICAGALRFLFSRKQIDRALYALQGTDTGVLSVEGVLEALQRQIQIMECSLRGFLTVELDFFIAVVATPNASELQQEVCMREVEKLASLVQRGSPRFLSELGLSALTTATVVHTMAESIASFIKISAATLILTVFIHVFR